MNRKILIIIVSVLILILGVSGSFWLFQGKEWNIQSEEKLSVIEDNNPKEERQVNNFLNEKDKIKENDSEIEDQVSEISEEPQGRKIKITERLVSQGFQNSIDREIDTVIIHSSYNPLGGDPYNLEAILNIYKDYGVAAHYIIDREGNIYKLVEEENIAYHAGLSEVPDGRKNVNDFSVGIEMINNEEDEYTDEQYKAVRDLVNDIESRYEIKYILGHNQIAPDRKTDPWNFDWELFTN